MSDPMCGFCHKNPSTSTGILNACDACIERMTKANRRQPKARMGATRVSCVA